MALGHWYQHRRAAQPHPRPRTQLSRRHDRHDVGRRARRLQSRPGSPCSFDVDTTSPSPHEKARNRPRSTRSKPPALQNRAPAAFIVEPLILGAGGDAHLPRLGARRKCAAICARHGVLFIADEVMDRLGPHRHALRVRPGGRDPRHRLPVEGPHRRRAPARRSPSASSRSSQRISRPTARRPSIIRRATPRTRSPAPPPPPISPSGATSPSSSGSTRLADAQAAHLSLLARDPRVANPAASAPSPRSISSSRTRAISRTSPRGLIALRPRPRRPPPPARQHRLCHAALFASRPRNFGAGTAARDQGNRQRWTLFSAPTALRPGVSHPHHLSIRTIEIHIY